MYFYRFGSIDLEYLKSMNFTLERFIEIMKTIIDETPYECLFDHGAIRAALPGIWERRVDRLLRPIRNIGFYNSSITRLVAGGDTQMNR